MKTNKNFQSDKYITFQLNKQNFAINVMKTKEVITIDEVINFPDSPNYVKGIINLRGNIVPIVNLGEKFRFETYFKLEDSKEQKVVIISINGKEVGLLVENVKQLITIEEEKISNTPEIAENIRKKHIKGIGKLKDKLLIIIDTNKIFSSKELDTLNNLKNN